jgi:hypothetical protein
VATATVLPLISEELDEVVVLANAGRRVTLHDAPDVAGKKAVLTGHDYVAEQFDGHIDF